MTSPAQSTDQHQLTRGFFPVVCGQDVHVDRGGGLVFLARRHLTVEHGGGQWLVSGGNLDISHGGGAAMIARSARVDSGFVGVLVAGDAQLAPGARVLLRATPALAVAAGAAFIAGWLLCGRRSRTATRRAEAFLSAM